ncbi:hypothetical protein [Paenibacillus sp. J2TS4]|uniref:hypothetical protein n=1 Tax=Paenibacillus sp. J2TS4 TaxID=2807194 RepID=UPI001B054A72|nr:hypothetical protein [Paenibacillus sp. J2TS4]GIP34404.1 hypothetical protein J2TS4_36140 [Paenibacillus sp. J2TS4]
MRNRTFQLMITGLLLAVLAACGTVQTDLPDGIAVPEDNIFITTQPEPPVAKQETTLTVELKKLPEPDDTTVDLEIRKEGSVRGKFIKTKPDKGGENFSTQTTFDDAGKYEVIIHIYAPDVHQTVPRDLEVQ